MAPSFLLALREGLEAALIIGIVLSILRKMGRQKLNSTVWVGVISAALVSLLAAVAMNWVGAEFEGQGEQLFEGLTMLLAAGVLTWMVFWMRKQSKTIKQEIESEVLQATQGRGERALFFLAFLAVVREGIELALFLLAARLTSNPLQEFSGAALGITTAAVLGWIIFASSRRLSLAKFFQTTNIFLAFFAAGLVGLGIHEFNELGWIPAIIDPAWNLNGLLPDQSTLGQLLKALVGYSSSPSLTMVIAYLGYFIILAAVLRAKRQTSLAQEPAAKPAAK